MTYLIIYINEANITLRFFIIIIYGFITLFSTGIVAFALFLIIEMPYKKLIKLYFNISSVLNKIYLEDEADEDAKNINDIGLNELNENDIEGINMDIGKEYQEKLIQYPIRIPCMNMDETEFAVNEANKQV